MNLSVKFDGKELGEYIDILPGLYAFCRPELGTQCDKQGRCDKR